MLVYQRVTTNRNFHRLVSKLPPFCRQVLGLPDRWGGGTGRSRASHHRGPGMGQFWCTLDHFGSFWHASHYQSTTPSIFDVAVRSLKKMRHMFGLYYCPKWWISWDTTKCGNILLGKMKFKTIGSWDLCIPYFHTGSHGPGLGWI
jgi:hypothetical protein